jgi:hypothetical protein
MQSVSMSEQQSTELCDRIGKMLVEQLESESIQNSIDEVIRDFISKNNLNVDPDTINNNIQVSVKVQMTR